MLPEQWPTVLWKRPPYSDNALPPSFLSSLRKNSNFRPYTYSHLVLASASVTQHIAAIFIFLAVFIHIYDHSWDPRLLVWCSAVCFIAGYFISHEAGTHEPPGNGANVVKSSILVFLALLALSPVLPDYGAPRRSRERLTSVLSINAAICSSVVLSSRLEDDLSVLALISFSVVIFALFPIFRARIQDALGLYRTAFTVTVAALSIYFHCSISGLVTWLLGASYLFITFIAPFFLVWAQKYKHEIRGAWDVAVPQVYTSKSQPLINI